MSDAARAVPGATIDWVVEEPFAAVAAMHPSVRRVIPVAVRRWRRAWWKKAVRAEMDAFASGLRSEQYDAVIDAQSLVKSALITRLAHGRRHGMDRASAREPLAAWFYDVRHNVPRGAHAVERNRRLTAAALGHSVDSPVDYGLNAVGYGLNAAGGETKGIVVFLTMTSRADKLWPEERWIALGRALAMPVVLPWGSDAERERGQRIAAALPGASVPGRMSLDKLGSLFATAQAVVGLDTGLTHLAAAVGARTVGIYCGSDPALTGLYGSATAANVGSLGRSPQVEEVLEKLR